MYLIVINDYVFIMFVVIFIFLIVTIISLIIKILRYIKTSSEEKRIIYNILNEKATKNNIVFLGDSLTEFYRVDEFFPNIKVYNRGIASNTTDDVLNRLYENVIDIEPCKLFVQIGTNDLGFNKSCEYVISNIKKIIHTLQNELPDTEIILLSLYPVNKHIMFHSKLTIAYRKNSNIDFINEELEKFSKTLGIAFIDVASHLKDEKGNLKKEYTIEGLHINLNGYIKITEILEPYVN